MTRAELAAAALLYTQVQQAEKKVLEAQQNLAWLKEKKSQSEHGWNVTFNLGDNYRAHNVMINIPNAVLEQQLIYALLEAHRELAKLI